MEGRIKAVFGNMVVAEVKGRVVKNAVGHCLRSDGAKLLCEAIRVRGRQVDLQIFEETRGLRVGDSVVFAEEMLSAHLGPGLLGRIYDGLQNPLPQLAEQAGFFLKALFQTTSAFGTVGLWPAAQVELTSMGKVLISATMFLGKVGTLTAVMAMASQESPPSYRYPEERVPIG